jgi:hypothetical protein
VHRNCGALLPLLLRTLPAPIARGQDAKASSSRFRLDSLDNLEVLNAKAEVATHEGRHAVRLLNRAEVVASGAANRGETIAILKGSDFKDGTIEAEIGGMPREGAPADVRGFIGIAFRVPPDKSHYECVYIRATYARADDQLRRITPHNMSPPLIFHGSGGGKKIPASRNRTWISKRAPGPGSRSWSRGQMQSCS